MFSLTRLLSQEIDGRALLLLTQEMLESLTENKLGPMTKIQSAVKALKQAWGIWKYECRLLYIINVTVLFRIHSSGDFADCTSFCSNILISFYFHPSSPQYQNTNSSSWSACIYHVTCSENLQIILLRSVACTPSLTFNVWWYVKGEIHCCSLFVRARRVEALLCRFIMITVLLLL